MIKLLHSCQPLLGVNYSPEFVNLYFPYAGQVVVVFFVVFFAGGSSILNSNQQCCAKYTCTLTSNKIYCTRPVSVHFARGGVGCSFNSFSIFLLSLKQNCMKIMFSCIHFPVWPNPPKIMRKTNVFYPGKLFGLTGML